MIGKTIVNYKILEKIGKGGMGEVYKAEDIRLKRTVALKFIPADLHKDPVSRERFIREARTASSLDHPNICTIHDFAETVDGQFFLVMAYYPGGNLAEKMKNSSLNNRDILLMGRQIAEGLQCAHKAGIIHRDIKPANIMLSDDGNIKIVDFGLAKGSSVDNITETGATLGTLAYMSPEQIEGMILDKRSDIWSFGVVLYEMVTGSNPFKGSSSAATLNSILNHKTKNLEKLRPDLPPNILLTVKKALVKDRTKRYSDFTDLLNDLVSDQNNITEQLAQSKNIDENEKGKKSSIAVLSFSDMSQKKDQEYFCDGIAEEITNKLTLVRNLRVAARTSAFSFKDKNDRISDIGNLLGVSNILQGSVRKNGDNLRITVQLIDVFDGFQICSRSYDRSLIDLFDIQDQIALDIVDTLKIELGIEEQKKIEKRYTDNIDAYNLFLKGQYYWNQLTLEGWKKSLECYEEVIEIDPEFAPAYASIAIWYQSLAYWGNMKPSLAFEKCRQFAEKALTIDESIASAHNCMAVLYFSYDRDKDKAQKAFDRMFQLDPTSALAHINYSIFMMISGNRDEAVKSAEKGKKLDPFSTIVQTWSAMINYQAGYIDDAIEDLKEIILKNPSDWQPYYNLSVAQTMKSLNSAACNLHDENFVDAVRSAYKAVELSGGASSAITSLIITLLLSGKKDKAEGYIKQLKTRADESYVPNTFFTWIYIAQGDEDKGVEYLNKALLDHDPWILWHRTSPAALITKNDRFESLLKKNDI